MEIIPTFYEATSRLFYVHYGRPGLCSVISRGKLRPYTEGRRERGTDTVTAVYDIQSYSSFYIIVGASVLWPAPSHCFAIYACPSFHVDNHRGFLASPAPLLSRLRVLLSHPVGRVSLFIKNRDRLAR